jgi:hypothetical protein
MAFGVAFDPDPKHTAKAPRNVKLGRETVSLGQGGFRLAMTREVER